MHGAAQWGFFRFAFEGNFVVFLRKFDPHEVWRTVEREGINNLSITGDAMARPMIEALEEMGGPDALDLSSLFVLASTAAIFSPTVKDQYLELFPNLMIIDAIGSSETGSNGMRMVAKGDTQNTGGGPTVQAGRDSVVLDEDFNEIEPGTGVQGRLARRGNVPLEYYKDPEKSAATFVTGPTACATPWPATWRSTRPTARSRCSGAARSASTPAARRSSPRRSRPRSRPTRPCSTPSSSACPTSAGASGSPRSCSPATAPSPTLDELDGHCREHVAGLQGAQGAPPRGRGGALPQRQARLPVGRQGRPRRDHRLNESEPQQGDVMQVQEKLFIGGEWVDPAGTDVIEVISPHTEEVVGRVPEGTTADIDRAVAAARTAFDEGEWPRHGARGAHRRRRAVRRASTPPA